MVQHITYKRIKEIFESEEEVTILDVLSRESYLKEHLPTAINIPLAELPQRISELNKQKPIIVYCGSLSCMASTRAAELLEKEGYTVWEYDGGLEDWIEHRLPVDGGS